VACGSEESTGDGFWGAFLAGRQNGDMDFVLSGLARIVFGAAMNHFTYDEGPYVSDGGRDDVAAAFMLQTAVTGIIYRTGEARAFGLNLGNGLGMGLQSQPGAGDTLTPLSSPPLVVNRADPSELIIAFFAGSSETEFNFAVMTTRTSCICALTNWGRISCWGVGTSCPRRPVGELEPISIPGLPYIAGGVTLNGHVEGAWFNQNDGFLEGEYSGTCVFAAAAPEFRCFGYQWGAGPLGPDTTQLEAGSPKVWTLPRGDRMVSLLCLPVGTSVCAFTESRSVVCVGRALIGRNVGQTGTDPMQMLSDVCKPDPQSGYVGEPCTVYRGDWRRWRARADGVNAQVPTPQGTLVGFIPTHGLPDGVYFGLFDDGAARAFVKVATRFGALPEDVPSPPQPFSTPVDLQELFSDPATQPAIIGIAGGKDHKCIVLANGTASCWGLSGGMGLR